MNAAAILERFRKGRSGTNDIDLTLRPALREVLSKFGNPQNNMPPVFHVAGTNGKGSTCAFLRAIVEASGHKAHVYTSPHLVHFNERIRIAGELINDDELTDILQACERYSEPGTITYFEAATIAAFVAFARHAADITILEVGLGGRLDVTNLVERKTATLITRLSYDHREFLGSTMREIAREKAGIMRAGAPCFIAQQPDAEAMNTLRETAAALGAPLKIAGKDWRVETTPFRFTSNARDITLPEPALRGAHQYDNAGLAIAASTALPFTISDEALATAMRSVDWPARLQKLSCHKLAKLLPPDWELWLDGGHNDSAGEILAQQAAIWRTQDNKPLHLICGMLSTKYPREFLGPLAPYISSLQAVPITGEALSLAPDQLATEAKATGIIQATTATDVSAALRQLAATQAQPARVLICGSLYLAGSVLGDL